MLSSILMKISPAEFASSPLLLWAPPVSSLVQQGWHTERGRTGILKWAKSLLLSRVWCCLWGLEHQGVSPAGKEAPAIIGAIYTQLLHSCPKLVVGQIASLSYRFGFKDTKHKTNFFLHNFKCILIQWWWIFYRLAFWIDFRFLWKCCHEILVK